MFFLNLSLGEFITLLGTVSGIVTALYLLDRAKRKKLVSTLRFWTTALTADEQQHRKRMQEPWSLILQLLGLLLLLLAIAQLQWGNKASRGRDHVLLLDTSAWTAGHDRDKTVLDREKRDALRYLESLGPADRVLLVRVDGLATPVTTFTNDHSQLTGGVNGSTSQYSALNLEQALDFARQAQRSSGGTPGEIVYIGPGKIPEAEPSLPRLPNLRTILVDASFENCGIRRIGVKRNDEEPDAWQAIVTIKNYGPKMQVVRLQTQYAGTLFQPRQLTLVPGQEASQEYDFTTNTAGRFVARIEPHDALPIDDQVSVQLPRSGLLSIALYTDRPEMLKPLFEANHQVRATYFSPAEYVPKPAFDVMVLDEIVAPSAPQIPSLWLAPPKDKSPFPVKAAVENATIINWHADTPLGAGLHAKVTSIPTAEVFESFQGDIPVASAAEGPIVIARPAGRGNERRAVIGFDPLSGPLRFEVTTPLLFANLLRWLSPEALRTVEVVAERVGDSVVRLDEGERTDGIRVSDEKGLSVPFTIRDRAVQLFSNKPKLIRISSGNGERFLSLTLPDVAPSRWNPPDGTLRGLPRVVAFAPGAVNLWQWLALLGGAALLAEWLIYGRQRKGAALRRSARSRVHPASEREGELAAK